jgi:hypothetical protein
MFIIYYSHCSCTMNMNVDYDYSDINNDIDDMIDDVLNNDNIDQLDISSDDGNFDDNDNYVKSNITGESQISGKRDINNSTLVNIRLNKLLEEFLMEPCEKLDFINTDINELPEIMKTFDTIKYLTINNCGLQNLKNLPPNVQTLDVKNNSIKSIFGSDIPQSVTHINACKNYIERIDLSESINIKELIVSNNLLDDTLIFPPNIETLHVASTNIYNTLPFVNLTKLKVLKANITNIDNIDNLPDNIIDLSVSRIMLYRTLGIVHKLPSKIEKFTCHSSGIRGFAFSHFPNTLDALDLYDNDLETLPGLPNKMSYIDIGKNKLKSVSNIPNEITSYDCTNNTALIFTAEQNELIKLHKGKFGVTVSLNNSNEKDMCNIAQEQMKDIYTSRYLNNVPDVPIPYASEQLEALNQLSSHSNMSHIGSKSNGFINDSFTSLLMNENHNDNNANVHRVRNLFNVHDNRNSNTSSSEFTGRGYTTRLEFTDRGCSNSIPSITTPSMSNGRSGNQPSMCRSSNLPPHIARLMSDNFSSSKRETHRIKHQHVYTV